MKKKVLINKIYKNFESKDGKPYRNPLVTIYFDLDDGTESKASAFVETGSKAMDWEAGDTMELEFVKKGEYVNFIPPNINDELRAIIKNLEAELEKYKAKLAKYEAKNQTDGSDMPF